MFQRLRRLMPTQQALRESRWLRWLGPTMFHPRLWHMSRRGIALGAAIGVFFAFLIPIAQIPLSVAASVALRANVPTAVMSTLVNNPITFPAVYWGAWRVGSAILGEDAHPDNAPALPGAQVPADLMDAKGLWRRTLRALHDVGLPMLVGAIAFAVCFGLVTYLMVNGVWHLHVRVKRRNRQRRRDRAG